jgi:UDP-N-acetylglucosamine--dolichyl-phosphate N-acetylglucosaminephosphotransferase
MYLFDQLGFSWNDVGILAGIGLTVFIITYLIYPPLIKWLKAKKWVGFDIHKKDRPETAESGGIGLTIGMLIGLILVGIFYPIIWNEVVVFIVTIAFAGIIGFIDDRIVLSSLKKIALMIATGIPVFIMNLLGYIHVQSPTLPIIGSIRITIIYPLVLPFIIAILTNTVNMLEGYNGEGSGTSSIAVFFLIICAIIARSTQGVIFGIPVLAAIIAFFLFNRYPAKVFPGDIGTLVIGAAIGLIGILGSIEVSMFLVMLTHVFNSFYVIASIRGFRESHDIKKKDIWMDDLDQIHASDEDGAAMSLPRLISAKESTTEPELVKNFLALTVVSGVFAVFGEVVRQWTIDAEHVDLPISVMIIFGCAIIYLVTVLRFPKIRGITFIMMILLISGALALYIINTFLVDTLLNWFYAFIIAGVVLIGWYYISVRYFWTMIDQMKKRPGYISTKEHQKIVEERKKQSENK